MTPVWNAPPAPVIGKRPRPVTTTSTFDGEQPPLSVNRTEKVIVVEGVPESGDAVPPASAGVVAPLQLPARAELDVVGTTSAATAAATARTTAFAVRSPIV